jgi:hypothetical protein
MPAVATVIRDQPPDPLPGRRARVAIEIGAAMIHPRSSRSRSEPRELNQEVNEEIPLRRRGGGRRRVRGKSPRARRSIAGTATQAWQLSTTGDSGWHLRRDERPGPENRGEEGKRKAAHRSISGRFRRRTITAII